MLTELHLQAVGPAPEFNLELANKLNIFTGDNGLGKTFLLDVVWYCLTGIWLDNPALPGSNGQQPTISCAVLNQNEIETFQSNFEFSIQKWIYNYRETFPKNLTIYVRVDGGFSVFGASDISSIHEFSHYTLWNGLKNNQNQVLCNGLLQDWVQWQNQSNQETFQLLSRVIRQLSPHPDEWMEPGEPVRISIQDVRDIPTIKMPYGTIPITHCSAGMKRILGLAYLLVWTWYEHLEVSKLRRKKPVDQIFLLIDEVEAHLHPQWQRSILPAVLEVAAALKEKINIQSFVTTHSPLVLASLEPIFDPDRDKLFLFELEGQEVTLQEFPWTKQGDTIGWLTSEIFGLKQARSKEAEIAIEAAQTWMRNEDMNTFPENLRTQAQIHQKLEKLLPGHDPFWPRWIVTSEKRRA